MSRQFDEYMMGKFELDEELYSLVEPTDIEEYVEALQIKDVIQSGVDRYAGMEDEENPYESIMQEQEEYIQDYIDSLPSYNNECLNKNIAFLLKKHGLRIGDLETLLDISAGYISRTFKANKKLSIDVVWKIASIFDVSLSELVNADLEIPNENIEIIIKFMEKLKAQTCSYEIEWEALGGIEFCASQDMLSTGLFVESDSACRYKPKHMNPNMKYYLADDVYCCRNFSEKKDLLIIAFTSEKLTNTSYDFILSDGKGNWERMFYTSDTPFFNLEVYASELFQKVKDQQFDVKLDKSVKQLMSGYIGK